MFADGVPRVVELAQRGDGEVVRLTATGCSDADSARLEEMFTQDRQPQWVELLDDCGKFNAEIDREISTGKFTLDELDEEEHSLERLRRWHRELKARDIFGAPAVRRCRPGPQTMHRAAGRLHRPGVPPSARNVSCRATFRGARSTPESSMNPAVWLFLQVNNVAEQRPGCTRSLPATPGTGRSCWRCS